MRCASSMLWVAITAAKPEACTSCVSAWNTWPAVRGSRLPVGSSASRMRGALATARAIATRCCSPPDSCAGRCSSRSFEAEIAEKLVGALARLLAREPADHLRQHHVLDRRKLRQQMVKLIDEADLGAADARALGIRQASRSRCRRHRPRRHRDARAGPRCAAASTCRCRTARSARPTAPATPQAPRL